MMSMLYEIVIKEHVGKKEKKSREKSIKEM